MRSLARCAVSGGFGKSKRRPYERLLLNRTEKAGRFRPHAATIRKSSALPGLANESPHQNQPAESNQCQRARLWDQHAIGDHLLREAVVTGCTSPATNQSLFGGLLTVGGRFTKVNGTCMVTFTS